MTLYEKRIAIAGSQGWTECKWSEANNCPCGIPPVAWQRSNPISKLSSKFRLPKYFDDPAAAVSLCEAMGNDGWNVIINHNGHTEMIWFCSAKQLGMNVGSQANTFPAAVAECYGKAKGLWE